MSKINTTNGLMHRLQIAFARLVGTGTNARARNDRRLAPLQELEDRCLLSVTPVGAEYRVNTYTQGNQQTSQQTPKAVAMNPTNGNYVVVWSSQGQNGGGSSDVYFQRYNAAGVPQGAETLVDIPVVGVNQQYANVAMDSSGNFVVTWSSQLLGTWNVYARQFNANGVAQGLPILVDLPSLNDQQWSSVAINASGEFIVTWTGDTAGIDQIYANIFNSSGVSQTGPVQVTNSSYYYQTFSQVALDNAGNFVLTWVDSVAGGTYNIDAEMFGSNNQPIGSVFQINTAVANESFPDVAMDAAGNFTITWSGDQSGTQNIYARSYLATGVVNGAVFQVGPTTGQSQVDPSIAFAGSGDPIITWSSQNQDGSGYGVYAQQFTPTGTSVGTELQVNTYTQGDQEYSSIAGAANGQVAIVWTSQNQDGNNAGVFGQNFTTGLSTATVTLTGGTFLVSEDNKVLQINAATGALVATYPTGLANDGATFGPDGSLYVADYNNNQIDHYNASGTLLSSFGAGVLTAPQALAIGPNGNLYVTNADGAVDQFSPTGTFLGTFIAAGTGGLTNAKAIVWGPDGNAYVSSFFNSEVLRFNGTTGAFMSVFATGGGGFEGITFGPDGNLYAASYGDNAVYRFDGTTGASLGTFTTGGALDNPFGLSFDPAGNLDVVNRTSGDIQTFSGASGAFLGTLASGLTNPAYLTAGNSSVYGQTVSYTVTVSAVAPVTGTPTGTVTFLDGTTDLATVSLTGGTAAFTTSALTVGSHAITVNYSGDGSFAAAASTALIQGVTPANLTITADDASKTYGQALTFAGTEFSTSGLVNSDTVSSVTLASAGAAATAAVAGSPYAITASAATGTGLSNYSVTYVNGALTVTPANLTITANDAAKTYGQTLTFAGTEFTTSGLVNSDTVSGVTLASAGAAPTAAVARSPYAIIASAATGTGLSNYSINYVNGALTVAPATLTVTADNASKISGQANPVFSDTLTGFVNGDNASAVNGAASLGTTATASSGVGSYVITAVQGSLTAANYNFAFANGALTITPAPTPTLTPTTATPPALTGAILLMPLTASNSSASASAETSSSTSLPRSAALLSPALSLATTVSNSGGDNNVAIASSSALTLSSGVNSATRTIQVFSPIPQAAWRQAQIVAALDPAETPLDMLVRRLSAASTPSAQAGPAQSDDGLDVLNDDGERVPWTEPGLEATMVVGTGAIAASGYVLLNSRLGLWLLGLLTSQPMWKQFDPLEVLYAWENEDRVTEDQEEETLLSLVD